MTGHQLVYAALLLGAFVLCAGGYGACYTIARLKRSPGWLSAAHSCYALQWVSALVIVTGTLLGTGWKLLILATCFATLRIPRVTWHYLELLHELGGFRDRQHH